jgi:transposase IS116/IS110/IS902 family protein
VTGDVRDVSRSGGRDRFAACNGTAPTGVSSGKRKAHRLSRRGNRRINHAVHMAAVTQIRYPHSGGRACYDKKLAEGKTPKEALRALKRQVSDAICKHLKTDSARIAASGAPVREGTRGTTLSPARPAHTPGAGSSAKPLPDQLLPCDQSQGPAKATSAGAACRASSGAGPGLPALPAPRGRRDGPVPCAARPENTAAAKPPHLPLDTKRIRSASRGLSVLAASRAQTERSVGHDMRVIFVRSWQPGCPPLRVAGGSRRDATRIPRAGPPFGVGSPR